MKPFITKKKLSMKDIEADKIVRNEHALTTDAAISKDAFLEVS
jgi:hypothetical protein